MTIRPATPADLPALIAMLRAEGVPACEMRVHDGLTAVLDDGGPVGLFTLETIDGWLHLRHFCLAPDMRGRDGAGQWRAPALMRAVCRMAREAGFTEMLVHAKGERLDRAVRYYFRPAVAYGRNSDGAVLYRVGIGG